jgi:clathrin heavy chain
MKSVQAGNISKVNEALNKLYIEDEDYEALRSSIDKFQNFNMIGLAQNLAEHELLEFRRISAYVYRCNKKWSQSIELSKNDKMWKDCIDTANESTDPEIIEKLLRYFCDADEKECFCAALYTCFAHISPDVALELGWVNGYHNFVMPFFIQTFKSTHTRLQALEDATRPAEDDKKAEDEIAQTYGAQGGLNGFNNVLMIGNGGPEMVPPPMPGMNGQIDMSGFHGAAPAMPPNGGMPLQMNGAM